MMPSITATIDMREVEAFEARLFDVIRNESIGQVIGTYGRELPILYGTGKGGDGEPLHDYNAAYARMMGIPLSPKTLSRGSGHLYNLVREGDSLMVADSQITSTSKSGKSRSVSARTVALGQQTGGSGRWGYSNIMFGVNESLQEKAAHELVTYIGGRVGG